MAELKRKAANCNFGTNLKEHLRDRFVSGMFSERIQRRLLQEDDALTWDKACQTALAMETASTEVKLLASDHRETQVNRVQQVLSKKETTPRESSARSSKGPTSSGTSSGTRRSIYCGRCGSAYHDAAECFFKDKKCFRYNRKGHTRQKCREKINVKNMEDEDVQLREQEDEEELFGILHVPEQSRKQRHPLYIVEVEVQDNQVENTTQEIKTRNI